MLLNPGASFHNSVGKRWELQPLRDRFVPGTMLDASCASSNPHSLYFKDKYTEAGKTESYKRWQEIPAGSMAWAAVSLQSVAHW